MSLLVKANPRGREIVKVTPQSAGWTRVGFEAFRLDAGEAIEIALPRDREGCPGVDRSPRSTSTRGPLDSGGAPAFMNARRMRLCTAGFALRLGVDAVEVALASAPAQDSIRHA